MLSASASSLGARAAWGMLASWACDSLPSLGYFRPLIVDAVAKAGLSRSCALLKSVLCLLCSCVA